jgi:hypothetical protein
MPRPKQVQEERISQLAARILAALVDFDPNSKGGQSADLEHALQHARRLTSRTDQQSTFEMEQLEALTGAIESLEHVRARRTGAVRLLEHLARPAGLITQ